MKSKADQPAAFQGTVKPAVSIILPYYEGNQWLRRTVGSVQQQTERNWELIVVDDGSENPADAVIGDIDDDRIRLLRIPHGGKGGALNRGVFESNGDHICFIDQDDRMLPGRLRLNCAPLRKNHVPTEFTRTMSGDMPTARCLIGSSAALWVQKRPFI